MSKRHLVIDIDRCNNCNNCFIATKDEHVGNDFPGYAAPQPLHGHRWIDIQRSERGRAPHVDIAHVPTLCNQCQDAPCVKAGGGKAVYQRSDGIVIIDPVAAKGRRDLLASCPYGAIWWNEELNLPQKWIFDAHLLDQGWPEPRCVQVCPTGAMESRFLSDEAMAEAAKQEGLSVLHPEWGLGPRIHYRALHRLTDCFVAGSVSTVKDGVHDCLEGVQVRLSRDGRDLGETITDCFGHFRIDGIAPESGGAELTLTRNGYRSRLLAVSFGRTQVLDDVRLEPISS